MNETVPVSAQQESPIIYPEGLTPEQWMKARLMTISAEELRHEVVRRACEAEDHAVHKEKIKRGLKICECGEWEWQRIPRPGTITLSES